MELYFVEHELLFDLSTEEPSLDVQKAVVGSKSRDWSGKPRMCALQLAP